MCCVHFVNEIKVGINKIVQNRHWEVGRRTERVEKKKKKQQRKNNNVKCHCCIFFTFFS